MDNMLPVRPVRPARDQDDEHEASTTRPEHHEAKNYREEKRKRGMRKPGMSVSPVVWMGLAAVIALVAVWFFFFRSGGTGIDGAKYQAVLLTDNSAYFGKLQVLNDKYMRLTDVYYLQSKTLQENGGDQNLQLIKLGEEVQGPTDEIIISTDKVVYFENLRDDGKVTTAIKKYLNEKKK